MKLSGNFPQRLLPLPKTMARPFAFVAFVLAALSLLVAGSFTSAQAADDSPYNILKKLAKEGVKCPIYAAEVAKLVKQYPKEADEIIAEAVKDEPPCACESVQLGLKALTPDGKDPDPQVVADVTLSVIRLIMISDPEHVQDLMEEIAACATEVSKDAGPLILNGMAGLFGNGGSKPGPPPVVPGTGGNPGRSPHPTPKPPPTPPGPVTGVKP